MSVILKLCNLNKIYGQNSNIQTQVLFDINLQVQTGSFNALVGPSGSGKSTLLNLIGLLERPSNGDLWINHQYTNELNDNQLTELRGNSLGFVFQFHHLLPAFTALENVLMPHIIKHGNTNTIAKQRAQSLLKAVGLKDAIDKKPNQLSGGMQQRVAIARSLMLKPPLILADEPTGNLDTHNATEIFTLMKKINKEEETAFIIVTHDTQLAQGCDQIFNLIDGRLL